MISVLYQNKRFNGFVNKYLMLIDSKDICLNNCKDIRTLYDEVFLNEVILEDPSNKPDGHIFRKQLVSVHSETDKVIHNGLMRIHPLPPIILRVSVGFFAEK